MPRARRWLSKDLTSLILGQAHDPRPYDVVIVGSGYGGAMAAAELAGCTDEEGRPVRICVLERGKEYLPGAFPSSLAELPTHVRYSSARAAQPKGPWDGLFDLRLGTDVASLVANGLGGGSLINGAVMEVPDWKSFNSRLPRQVENSLTEQFYSEVRQRLGARIKDEKEHKPLAKTEALRRLDRGEGNFRLAALTIADPERKSEHGRPGPRLSQANLPLNPCLNCGDCMTGCNAGARESLDTNLLVQAWAGGAEIYTGAAVLSLQRKAPECAGPYWELLVVHTDAQMRKQESEPLTLRAARVILAAGTFGSTEILMRSIANGLRFSGRLGKQFSCNGDNIALVYGCAEAVNTVADEHQPFCEREVGPTITGVLPVPADAQYPRFLMQEFAVPAALKRLFEEAVTTSRMLHGLGVQQPEGASGKDPCAVDDDAIGKSALIGFIGHDSALGTLHLPHRLKGAEGSGQPLPAEGVLQVQWPEARNEAMLMNNLDQLKRRIPAGAQILPNPLWKMLPDMLSELVDQPLGPVLTVHPLGGCAMADSPARGVVNEWGQVYRGDAAEGEVWDGLMVLDGAIIPSSLGANPALTIAALALRAVTRLRGDWGWTPGAARLVNPLPPRPLARSLSECQPVQGVPTEVRLVERLRGKARLQIAGEPGDYMIELTLRYKHKPLRELMAPAEKLLVLDSAVADDDASSRLRIYPIAAWNAQRLEFADDAAKDRAATASVPLGGKLQLLMREPAGDLGAFRALVSWFVNRGARDTLQRLMDSSRTGGFGTFMKSLGSMLPLAHRAGEVRNFDYQLKVQADGGPFRAGDVIAGGKRFTYDRRANPFRQLTQLRLSRFPTLCPNTSAVLELDLRFLAREKLPLMRVTAQTSQVAAMADFFAFGMYIGRLMLGIHLWSFRKPDDPSARAPQRLPGAVTGLPRPDVIDIEIDTIYKQKVTVRLTRYAHVGGPPLVMIHGYSASGTTFAHDKVPVSMAKYFHERGRDIWILDLRTSAGMPTAWYKWDFEDAAFADIPVAIAHICKVTGKDKVDIFAHCIGAVMVSMALLTDPGNIEAMTANFCRPRKGQPRRYDNELRTMQKSIRSLVLSQKGPALAYTENNVLRAYLAAYLRRALLPGDYAFRRRPEPSLAEQLLDRVLSALPYPEEEFDIENPFWPPWKRTSWVGTRHRMDALYGRDFSVRNIAPETLEYIDDLFGPLNLDTVSQTTFMARFNCIANAGGECGFLSRANLQRCWKDIPTMSVHGAENGLADVETLKLMKDAMCDAGVPFRMMRFENYGHQDMLIGRNAARDVFPGIEGFFKTATDVPGPGPADDAPVRSAEHRFEFPWLGPRIAPDGDGRLALWVASDPATPAVRIVCVPVRRDGNEMHYRLAASDQLIVAEDQEPGRPAWRKADWPGPIAMTDATAVLVLLAPESEARLGRHGFDSHPPMVGGYVPASGPAPGLLMNIIFTPAEVQAYLDNKTVDQLESATVCCNVWERSLLAREPACPAAGTAFTIAFGSCQYPTGLFDRPLAEQSLQRLYDSIRSSEQSESERESASACVPPPSLLLLLGDQVYVDATAGMLDPTRQDAQYLQPYQDFYGMAPLRVLLPRIPMHSMLDDHEIIDNWEPYPNSPYDAARKQAGVLAYKSWQRPGYKAADGPLSYHFTHFSVPIFMTDTRSGRMSRNASTLAQAEILDSVQMLSLRQWLVLQDRADPERPKVIAGPAMLLPRRLAGLDPVPEDSLHSDAWDGYPASLHQLLGFIACRGISNVLFISGDEHLANVAFIDVTLPGRDPVRIHSVHTGALYAPIPFANSVPTDFRANERFEIDCGNQGMAQVAVHTSFVQNGDGYTELAMQRTAQGWEVRCRFRQALEDTEVVLIPSPDGPSSGAGPDLANTSCFQSAP